MSEIVLLCITAGSVAMVHTLLGPDHYLPFVAMAKSRGWSLVRTMRMTLLCGFGHILGSILLGVVGVAIGSQLASLNWIEGMRADLAAWALMALGMVYFAWGTRHAYKHRTEIEHSVVHGHSHLESDEPHTHHNSASTNNSHQHFGVTHSHSHGAFSHTHDDVARRRTPSAYWALFIVFVLGPCEPLIPLLMYPAALGNVWAAVVVSCVFGLVTMLTMLFAVVVSVWGLSFIKMPKIERYSHALAGSTILMCGASMVFLGL